MNILGLHDGHNASAALLCDGQMVACLSEERLSYRKNDMGFPKNAIDECLRIAHLEPSQIDLVAFSTINLPLRYMRIKREFAFTVRDWLDEQEYFWKPKLFEGRENKNYLESLVKQERFTEPQVYQFDGIPLHLTAEENIKQLDLLRKKALLEHYGIPANKVVVHRHHTCHQYYAYWGSPFRNEDTLILTADGGGDSANGTVSVAKSNEIRELASNNCTDLGRIYRYITLILGMKIGEHEYKVMGLAPYASDYEKRKCDKVFKNIFHVPNLLIEYKNRPKDLFFHFREALADCRFDGIAGAAQEMVEEIGIEWVRQCVKQTGIHRVVFSGGLAMNVKLNKMICELPEIDSFYCAASGGDESLSMGACFVSASQYNESPIASIEDNYLGDCAYRSEILSEVKKLKGVTIQEGVDNKQLARLLAKDKIIGRMAGRMEFGARSLGNRSILANPANEQNRQRINKQIKFRDFWMPFAPSVLDSAAPAYLINPKKHHSDHMTLAFDTTELGAKVLAAAIHPEDGTVRAHIVRQSINPDYYDLIKAFENITGVGALLNTSFNLHGYPIVYQPKHAVHVFKNSLLDGMILEDVLVLRS